MTKNQLIELIAQKTNLTKKIVREVLEAFLDGVKKSLNKGEKVILYGFGTLKVVNVKAKKGRNMKTGETIVVKPHRAVRFVVSKTLKKLVK